MSTYQENNNRSVNITSVLMGIFMDIACIMVYLFPSEDGRTSTGGVVSLIYIILIASLLFMSVYNHTLSFSKINKFVWVTEIGIILFYTYSSLIYPQPYTPINRFYVFTLAAILLSSISLLNIKVFLMTVMFGAVPAILKYNDIFEPLFYAGDTLSMGYSYSFLTPIICSIVYFKYYLKYDYGLMKILNVLAFTINMCYAFFIVALGSRGPVVAIILLIFLPYMFEISPSMNGIRLKKTKAIVLFIATIIILSNVIDILLLCQSWLDSAGVSLNFINKFLLRNEAGDMTSNRSDIWNLAIAGFYKHPLFGNGFDQFANNTIWAYPHNFFSQILYDGGIFLFSITILPFLIHLKKWYQNCSFNEYVIIVALMFASIPGACFSGDLWTMGNLWVLYGAVLNYKIISNN